MKVKKTEGVPIARLLGEEGKPIGWVYLWNTTELSLLWLGRLREVKSIDPPLDPKTLAKAKAVSSDKVTDFLETLLADGHARH